MKILALRAGGLIGSHLAERLKQDGHWVRAVDLKHPRHAATVADENDAAILHNACAINLNVLDACRRRNVTRIF